MFDVTDDLIDEIARLKKSNKKLKLLAESYRAMLAKTLNAIEQTIYDFDPDDGDHGPDLNEIHLIILTTAAREAREALEGK